MQWSKIFYNALNKLFGNITSYKIWIWGAGCVALFAGKIEGWQWMALSMTVVTGRVVEGIRKNGEK